MTPNLKLRRINEYNDMLCIDLDNDSETHLFRHASEITRETKGGYLKGKISIPMTDKPCYLRLSLVPAERDMKNEFDLHPNLLHINLRQNKKNRRIEAGELPDDVDWAFVFRVDPDGNVSRVYSTIPERRFVDLQNESEAIRGISPKSGDFDSNDMSINYGQNTCLGPLKLPSFSCLSLNRVTIVKDRKHIDLGTTGLMLNIITPLQKFSKGGITLTDVLKQRYQDLQQNSMPNTLVRNMEDYYTNKKDKVKLQRVRLMAEIFGCDLEFQKSNTSQIITNSKSKECGPLSLHDVNPAASCVQSRTKIFMLSFFKLVSEVKAAFILWNKEENSTVNDQSILTRLKQPEDCTVFNQTVISCFAPPQSWDVIQEIRQKNLELRIFAYRPSDNRLSRNSFKFEYLEHVSTNLPNKNNFYGPSGPICGFCYLQQYNDIKEELSLAKPGVQRRKHDKYNEVPENLLQKTKEANNGRPEILRKRSVEIEDGPSSTQYYNQKSPQEPVKLEPITVKSLESNQGSKSLFEIVMSPAEVMDLSVRNHGDFLNHPNPKKRMIPNSQSNTEICDPERSFKRSKLDLVHSKHV